MTDDERVSHDPLFRLPRREGGYETFLPEEAPASRPKPTIVASVIRPADVTMVMAWLRSGCLLPSSTRKPGRS